MMISRLDPRCRNALAPTESRIAGTHARRTDSDTVGQHLDVRVLASPDPGQLHGPRRVPRRHAGENNPMASSKYSSSGEMRSESGSLRGRTGSIQPTPDSPTGPSRSISPACWSRRQRRRHSAQFTHRGRKEPNDERHHTPDGHRLRVDRPVQQMRPGPGERPGRLLHAVPRRGRLRGDDRRCLGRPGDVLRCLLPATQRRRVLLLGQTGRPVHRGPGGDPRCAGIRPLRAQAHR